MSLGLRQTQTDLIPTELLEKYQAARQILEAAEKAGLNKIRLAALEELEDLVQQMTHEVKAKLKA